MTHATFAWSVLPLCLAVGCSKGPDATTIDSIERCGITVTGTSAEGYSIAIVGDKTDKVIRDAHEQLRLLRGLRFVIVKSNRITDEGLSLIAALQEVESIYLDSVPISRRSLNCLSQMPRLRKLQMVNMQCRGEDIAALATSESLESLALGDCRIDDAVLEQVAKIKTLHTAQFVDTAVSPEAMRNLKSKRPDVQIACW